MMVKYIFLPVLCAIVLFCCHGSQGGSVYWTKLNHHGPVCFGAKDNKYGAFTYGNNAFTWQFMLKHRSGYVTCIMGGGNSTRSPWGCTANHKNIQTFLTDERNTIVGPRFSQPIAQHYYHLPGYHANSPFLIFFMGKSAYGLQRYGELRLWYGEDLFDVGESDNGGTSCADVYGLL